MKKVATVLIAFIIVLLSTNCRGQEIKFKALYLYNFTKYVGWPQAAKSGDFVIGVVGSNAIYNKLMEVASGKMAGSQKIVVKKFGKIEEVVKCHILFIAYGKAGASSLQSVMQKVGGNATLVVSEREGATKNGAAINFVIRNEQMKFELNKANALKQGLQISLNLEKLAILVD